MPYSFRHLPIYHSYQVEDGKGQKVCRTEMAAQGRLITNLLNQHEEWEPIRGMLHDMAASCLKALEHKQINMDPDAEWWAGHEAAVNEQPLSSDKSTQWFKGWCVGQHKMGGEAFEEGEPLEGDRCESWQNGWKEAFEARMAEQDFREGFEAQRAGHPFDSTYRSVNWQKGWLSSVEIEGHPKEAWESWKDGFLASLNPRKN